MRIWVGAFLALATAACRSAPAGGGAGGAAYAAPPEQEVAPDGGALEVRVTSRGERIRVKSGDTVLGESPSAPGREVRLRVPRGPVRVEFLDAAGAVAASVDLAAAPEAEAPAARVGEVRLVHRVYGVFVRLEPGQELRPGEEIVVVREGREVARTRVLQITSGDETYPAGAARLPRGDAPIRKGDEVRRPDR
jgi:hypothetical protein